MRAREILKLQEGDVITCRECPHTGCDGSETEVHISKDRCGCAMYRHFGQNCFPFYGISCGTHYYGLRGWARRRFGEEERITGRSIKLVRRAGK